MKVEITLRRGDDPYIWDADTKESLRSRCQTITIALDPGRRGKVTLKLLKHDAKGEPYVEDNGEGGQVAATETVEADLVYLAGHWEPEPK